MTAEFIIIIIIIVIIIIIMPMIKGTCQNL